MTTNTLRDLSGSSSYWNISNPIGAKSDVDVVKAWIQHSCSNSQHTLNSYVKDEAFEIDGKLAKVLGIVI